MKPSLQFIFGNIFLTHFLFRLQASLVLLEGYISWKSHANWNCANWTQNSHSKLYFLGVRVL